MTVTICRERVKLIPENEADRKRLSENKRMATDIQGSLNNVPGIIELMKTVSGESRKVIWEAVWIAYCAGISDGRLNRQIEIDSRSYTP